MEVSIMAMSTKDFSDKIVSLMEQNKAPWQRAWKINEAYNEGFRNAFTGREYHGFNVLVLHLACMMNGWSDTRFATFNQAKNNGKSIVKGSKGTNVFFFNIYTKKNEDDEEEYTKFFAKSFTVFNVEQMNGFPVSVHTIPEWNPIVIGEDILRNSNAVIEYHGNEAFYNPLTDKIILPVRNAFSSEAGFYATALHELAHWTGHKGRLDREDKFGRHMGDEAYAREELRAEISSWMLSMATGLPFNPTNHVAYLQHWIKALKHAYREITRACNDADKICQYLLAFVGMERKEEEGKEEEKAS